MHILHLEDDGPLREILKVALTAADPNINMPQFSRAEPALEYIEQNKQSIDVFILDIRLPGAIDGIQVATKIRELGCPGAIVITSAFIRPTEDTLKGLNCVWLSKPWHIIDAPVKIFELVKTKPAAGLPSATISGKFKPSPPAVKEASPPPPVDANAVMGSADAPSSEVSVVEPASSDSPADQPLEAPPVMVNPERPKTAPLVTPPDVAEHPKTAPLVTPPEKPERPKTAPLVRPPSE